MNTNMKENNTKELNLNELEQANGGIQPLALGFGTIAIGAAIIAYWAKTKKS